MLSFLFLCFGPSKYSLFFNDQKTAKFNWNKFIIQATNNDVTTFVSLAVFPSLPPPNLAHTHYRHIKVCLPRWVRWIRFSTQKIWTAWPGVRAGLRVERAELGCLLAGSPWASYFASLCVSVLSIKGEWQAHSGCVDWMSNVCKTLGTGFAQAKHLNM